MRVLGTPGAVYGAQQFPMQPFSAAAANIMGLNWLVANALPVKADGTLARLGISPTGARRFLQAKASLAA